MERVRRQRFDGFAEFFQVFFDFIRKDFRVIFATEAAETDQNRQIGEFFVVIQQQIENVHQMLRRWRARQNVNGD